MTNALEANGISVRYGGNLAVDGVDVAVPAGKMIGIMEDTVDWGSTPAATSDPQPSGLEADRGPDESAQIR